MSKRLSLDGKVALVTGAASGIGRAIAVSLASRGCHLALADLDQAGLEETARLITNRVRVTRHRLDVADRAAVAALPGDLVALHGGLDILVNNAGVALGGTFDEVSEADFDWVVGINFAAVVRLTRAFLPLLKQRPQAQLVNVSSLFGLLAPPGQAAYAASKFAVRGFSEALRNELLAAGSTVGVTVVHPGGVRTAIASNARNSRDADPLRDAAERARFEKLLRLAPEKAGEVIVKAIEHRRPRVLVGSDAKALAMIERLMPVHYWRLVGRLLGS